MMIWPTFLLYPRSLLALTAEVYSAPFPSLQAAPVLPIADCILFLAAEHIACYS